MLTNIFFSKVQFKRPPTIIEQPESNVYYIPGESVLLPCKADGFPAPV
jgi:hypothetical protein